MTGAARRHEALWRAEEVASTTGGRPAGAGDWRASGVSIDSRTLMPGDLFIALAGARFDGHAFVADALSAGAAAAVVARAPKDMRGDAPLVHVADTAAALRALAVAARGRTPARIACITGSVGKTSTKDALALALGRQGRVHASAGNLNNQLGAPLSLARMARETDFGVFELGMNRPGEIRPLARMARPDVGIITNIGDAHRAFFADTAGIARAKAEMFAGMGREGVAVLNRGAKHFDLLAAAAREIGAIITFGEDAATDFRLAAYEPGVGDAPARATILARGRPITVRLAVAGRHWAINATAVLAAVEALGADIPSAAAALEGLEPAAGRGRRIDCAVAGGAFTLIDDSYNASPASMRAAIAVLAAHDGRKLAVLGDMRELGAAAETLHAALADDLSAAGVDLVFCAGVHMAALFAALPAAMRGAHAGDSRGLLAALAGRVRAGDVVLVKGSLGSHMGRIVEGLRASDGASQARDAEAVAC